MLLLQFVEIRLEELSVNYTAKYPDNINLKQPKQLSIGTQNILVGLTIVKPVLNFKVNQKEKLSIILKSPVSYLKIQNRKAQRLEKGFTIKGMSLNMEMPFGFTDDFCVQKSKLYLDLEDVEFIYSPSMCTTYRDIKYFQNFSQKLKVYIHKFINKFQKSIKPVIPKKMQVTTKRLRWLLTELEEI